MISDEGQMAPKATVHERCEKCGQRDARLEGNQVIRSLHRCPKAPPGPQSAPHPLPLSQVNFIPAEWTPEEMLVEANDKIERLEIRNTRLEEMIGDAKSALS